MNFTYKLIKNESVIERYETHSKRKFYNKIRTINWNSPYQKVYLRVSYGKSMTNFGKIENFWNDGDYFNYKDLKLAFDAFTEN